LKTQRGQLSPGLRRRVPTVGSRPMAIRFAVRTGRARHRHIPQRQWLRHRVQAADMERSATLVTLERATSMESIFRVAWPKCQLKGEVVGA
jgi:hypothetical protein